MTLAELRPFESAVQSLARRKALPTNLDSAGLRQLGAAWHRQNFVSAQNTISGVINDIKKAVESVVNPVTETRADRITPENPMGYVTTGMNPADARQAIRESLKEFGYSPDPDVRGTIKDLSSSARINLVVKTNTELSQGAGFAIKSNDPAVLEAFPCWELYRLEEKKVERNWATRWRLAAQVSGDVDAARVLEESGRMVARKDSPIWQALGDGEGFDDTLGNPFPPFAFNSGMWTRDVSYDDAESLGLVNLNTKVESNLPDDLAQLFGVAA